MATTDTRPGFRLPWNSDRADAEGNGTEPTEAAQATDAQAVAEAATDAAAETDVPADGSGNEAADAPVASVETEPVVETPPAEPAIVSETESVSEPVAEAKPSKAAGKKPNKFLADLTRAMQATAETERNETLERFSAEAKAAVEAVHAAAAEETAELRRVADDDVTGIRDWSKAEIARIREETENRISGRKADLERELELHAGTIEGRIERVNARVASFESEVTDFYERLFAEEDPTRFAAMAEQLPEAPSLDMPLDDAAMIGAAAKAAIVESPVEAVIETVDAPVEPVVVEATAEVEAPVVEPAPEAVETPAAPVEPEAAAVEASDEPVAIEGDAASPVADDPRLAALKLAPSFEAAEAEAALAAADAAPAEAPEEIPTIADEVLAARLAGLVPEENAESPIQTTKVVVTGLVSVASIAGFKRHLGRLQGVTTVGVSSGPDGEFVFSVHHVATMDLAAGITGLPGFESRITNQGEGSIEVAARDPEAHD